MDLEDANPKRIKSSRSGHVAIFAQAFTDTEAKEHSKEHSMDTYDKSADIWALRTVTLSLLDDDVFMRSLYEPSRDELMIVKIFPSAACSSRTSGTMLWNGTLRQEPCIGTIGIFYSCVESEVSVGLHVKMAEIVGLARHVQQRAK